MGVVYRVILVALMAVILRWGSVIVTAYACYYAFTNASGNRYGLWMILLAILAVCISALTWILRFKGIVQV